MFEFLERGSDIGVREVDTKDVSTLGGVVAAQGAEVLAAGFDGEFLRLC